MKANIALGASLVAVLVAVASTVGPNLADRLSSEACVAPVAIVGTDFDAITALAAEFGRDKIVAAKASANDKAFAQTGIITGGWEGKSAVKVDGKSVKLGPGTVEVVVGVQVGSDMKFYNLLVSKSCEGGEWEVVGSSEA